MSKTSEALEMDFYLELVKGKDKQMNIFYQLSTSASFENGNNIQLNYLASSS